VSTRKAVMVAFCAWERDIRRVERIEMVERLCIFAVVKILSELCARVVVIEF
jgi:hypothetical protein